MTVHYLVLAGTKPFACYASKEDADATKALFTAASLQASVTVAEVTPGIPDNFADTCDNFLKGKDAIVSEVVSILDAT